jgi:hypothetical protein
MVHWIWIEICLDGDVKLQGYTDSDWAGSAVDRKSTSGCCFSLGSGMASHG